MNHLSSLIRDIFVDFSSYLSKTLVGSQGQDLLVEGNYTRIKLIYSFENMFFSIVDKMAFIEITFLLKYNLKSNLS